MSIHNAGRLSKLLSLPLTRQVRDGTYVVIDKLKEADVKEAYKVFMRYAADGDGVSKDEFKTVDDFHKRMFHDSVSYYAKDTTGKFVGIFNIIPSGISRSTYPITHAGYVILNPEMVNKGIGREIFALYFYIGAVLGFTGISGRTASSNVLSYLSLRRVGLEFQGHIADSYNQGDGVWRDDVIFTFNTKKTDIYQTICDSYPPPPLPVLPPYSNLSSEKLIADTWTINGYSANKTLPNGKEVKITQCQSSVDMLCIEQMIHMNAASESGGFAVDEFNDDGMWNRRLLTKWATLVMKDTSSQDVIGAAIIGPSKLSRSSEPVLLGTYLIVNDNYKRQNVASILEGECFKIACDNHFSMCVADIYVLNHSGIKLAHSLGYKVQGSVYRSGYFKEQGYVDTLLYYKFCELNRALEFLVSVL